LPHQWRESIVVPIHKKGDETDCSNYRGISLLSTSDKVLSNILLSRLIPYADEIIGDHQCGFQRNRSTTDQIFYIGQILEKKCEYNGTVHQLFIDFKKAYDSVRREALYNILIEFGIPRKLMGLIKMCLNETYIRVRIGKNLSDKFTIENGLKEGDAFITTAFQLCFEICHQEGPREPGRTHIEWDTSGLAYAGDVNIVGENIHSIQKNTKALLDASKEVGLEVNPEKIKYMLVSEVRTEAEHICRE
jgi:hypothetical protein